MIFIGGLTRLTNSGLSITEWELFKGILPPINDLSWKKYFELYQKIPQYEIVNPSMSLNEFKVIFYWEYFHRILGRFIGLFFLIPLIYFYFKKINRFYLVPCSIVMVLIVFQGFIGWYMVTSGLVNNVTVSHYRLSIHLSIAILIISIIFWQILNLERSETKVFFRFDKKRLPYSLLILLIFFQIIFGAFVSGLDAGKVYQSWPLMGLNYFPDDIKTNNILNFFDFENHSLVQFYHRNIAYLISIYILIICFLVFKNKKKELYKSSSILLVFLFLLQTLKIHFYYSFQTLKKRNLLPLLHLVQLYHKDFYQNLFLHLLHLS